MTREEMLAVAKPILFNTEMVRAVKDNRKTATRRVVKPQPIIYGFLETCFDWSNVKAPYRPGDFLYVRETFCVWHLPILGIKYCYKATDPNGNRRPTGTNPDDEWEVRPWQPSIHMPRDAARIFLRVTGVKVCRLQDITEEQAKAEGAVKAYPYIDPATQKTEYMESEYGDYLAGFECLWNSTIKPADRALYGWDANPWVWGIDFKRVEAEQ